MKQSPLVEFESSNFRVIPGEDQDTNSGIYGKALEMWVRDRLRIATVPAGEVIGEDFGWCVPVKSVPYTMYVACSNVEGTANHWRVFAFIEGGIWAGLFGKDKATEPLESLFHVVHAVIASEPGICLVSQKPPI
jgi:hypothetical protein